MNDNYPPGVTSDDIDNLFGDDTEPVERIYEDEDDMIEQTEDEILFD